MKKAELVQLNEIATLMSEVDLAKLAALQKVHDELSERAAALSANVEVSAETGELDPALRAGAGQLWDKWRSDRLIELQAERARIAAEIEAARQKASRSFGRTVALSELIEKTAR